MIQPPKDKQSLVRAFLARVLSAIKAANPYDLIGRLVVFLACFAFVLFAVYVMILGSEVAAERLGTYALLIFAATGVGVSFASSIIAAIYVHTKKEKE